MYSIQRLVSTLHFTVHTAFAHASGLYTHSC